VQPDDDAAGRSSRRISSDLSPCGAERGEAPHVVQTPLIDISSTEVRRRLAAEDVRGMLHPDVIEYTPHGLYQRSDALEDRIITTW
jgi:nicotinic acid mononucleotide adenylyltransferase